MKYDFNVDEKWRVKVKVNVETAEYEKAYNDILSEFKKHAKMPGFRPGKAPIGLVEKKYKDDIEKEVISELTKKGVNEFLIKEKDMHILNDPTIINFKKNDNKSIEFEFVFDILPQVEIKDYKNIKIDVEKKEVTDKLIDENIDLLRKMYADLEDYDGELEEGDVAICDIFIFDENNKELEELRSNDYSIELGSKYVFKEINDNLLHKKKGDRVEFKFTYPEDLDDELLKGKTVTFRIDVKETKRKKLPEINEEFLKKFYLNNEEQLREATKARLENEFAKEYEMEKSKQIIDNIIEKNPFEVPQSLVDSHYKNLLEQYKIKEESINEKLKEEYTKHAVWRAKRDVIFMQLIKQENINVTDEDVQNKIDEYRKQASPQMSDYIESDDFKSRVKNDIYFEKVEELLNNSIENNEKKTQENNSEKEEIKNEGNNKNGEE